jgi:phosphoglycolate phosphatase
VTEASPGRWRLVLWDVDGTLIHAGPVARAAFDLAVARALGRDPGDHGVDTSGKTDPEIAREILAALALSGNEVARHLPGVLAGLQAALSGAVEEVRRHGRVLPGVEELLPRLHATPGVVQTVLTGNLAANALVKLQAFGLDRWLDLEVGAYGSDHHDRRRLVPLAMGRATARHGHRFEREEVWVVGDTPRDLACARAAGVRCLLVATGRQYGLEDLRGLGADAVLPDLSDVEAVVDLLVGSG